MLAPVLLGLATAASYSTLPYLSVGEAPYQAAWVATGVSLTNILLQAIVETQEEVTLYRS
jgi:hypothetical protein